MELFYKEYGSGYPLVILHGLYGSSDNWTSVARELSDSYRVILPDQRNHGRSPHNKVHTYNAMSEDLHDLISKLGIERFILAGHSMGGKTAAYFALKWPELLSGLIIIDISPFRKETSDNEAEREHESILEKMVQTDLSEIHDRDQADNAFRSISGSSRVRSFILKNMRRDRNGRFEWKLDPAILKDNLNNIFDGLDENSFSDGPVTGFPVFVLRALRSSYINEKDYQLIEKYFPAAEIIEIPDAGHWVHADKPEAITGLIRENFPVHD